MGREFIGIERDENYIKAAKLRIAQVVPKIDKIARGELETKPPKVSLSALIKAGFLENGEKFYDKNGKFICTLQGDKVRDDSEILSIHQMAAKQLKRSNYNGWGYFYVFKGEEFVGINALRYAYRAKREIC